MDDCIVQCFPKIDSAAVDYGNGAVELDDLIFRRTSFSPNDFCARRNGDYIWWDMWTGLLVCNRSVDHLTDLDDAVYDWIGSAEVALHHHLLPAVSRSTSHDMEVPFHSPLCQHPVWPDGGSVFAELDMSRHDPFLCVCRQLLAFNPAVHRTASGEGKMYSLPPCFRLILTFYYCLYEFLREQELGTGRSPDTDKADSFHENDFAPDIQDTMALWALRPHAILVKVISVCRLHVFFYQYVADLREERSENVLRTVSASPFIFDVTVSSTSGVITTPPEGLAREVLPLITGVNILHGVNRGTPLVVPLVLDIERPVMQLHDFLTYRTPESRQSSLFISLSAPFPRSRCRGNRQNFRRLRFRSRLGRFLGSLRHGQRDQRPLRMSTPSTFPAVTNFPSEGPRGTTPVLRVTHRYSESGDLLCFDGNPA